jgi:hypothetical protein
MIAKLQRLIKYVFRINKKPKTTKQLLDCYCEETPWAASCRIYEE